MTPYTARTFAATPPKPTRPEFLTLEELEAIAWEFRADGVSILAAGDEWHLQIRDERGVQRTFRAHRPQGGAA